MRCEPSASLKELNSFAVDASAAQITTIDTVIEMQQFIKQNSFDAQCDLILGGGSNTLFTGDIVGTVLLNRIKGRTIIHDTKDVVLVEVSAGENWHEFVLWTLDKGLTGLENLSLIPGLAGAAPIQNIGAYGVELSDVLEEVEVVNLVSGSIKIYTNNNCKFSYRDSRFKSIDPGKYMITGMRLKLRRKFKPALHYQGLRDELTTMGVHKATQPTAVQVSDAVIRLRQRKLPDPAVAANAGSFFKNPMVTHMQATEMKQRFSNLPAFSLENGRTRLSAAWMIEQCGWKGRTMGRAAVSTQHALVLVNTGGATGKELLELADAIKLSVRGRFGVNLQTEPSIVPRAV